LKREVLDLIGPGDDLVEETFSRLIARGEVMAYPYEGFFGPMDTIKDRQRLEALHQSGEAPWRGVDPDGIGPPAKQADVDAAPVGR
jgi:glucose-1-phosphate cytidylyltransferase